MKNVATRVTVNSVPDRRPTVIVNTRQSACSANAIPIASSRPVLSDTQPQKMRLPPLATAFNDVASTSAAAGMPHAPAIELALAVTSRPPVDIIRNIA